MENQPNEGGRSYPFMFHPARDPETGEQPPPHEVMVSEFDLTHEQVNILAQLIYQTFKTMPGPSQDIFLRQIADEMANDREIASESRNEPLMIINAQGDPQWQ